MFGKTFQTMITRP